MATWMTAAQARSDTSTARSSNTNRVSSARRSQHGKCRGTGLQVRGMPAAPAREARRGARGHVRDRSRSSSSTIEAPTNRGRRSSSSPTHDAHVRLVRLSRNFGQHAAITAGLEHARGEWIVVMDCDLQDPPEQISALYGRALEGYDVVLARRIGSGNSFARRLASAAYFRRPQRSARDRVRRRLRQLQRHLPEGADGVPPRARQGPPLPDDPALAGVPNDVDRPAARRPLCRGELLLVRDADAICAGRAVLPDDDAAPMDRLRRLRDLGAGDAPGRASSSSTTSPAIRTRGGRASASCSCWSEASSSPAPG